MHYIKKFVQIIRPHTKYVTTEEFSTENGSGYDIKVGLTDPYTSSGFTFKFGRGKNKKKNIVVEKVFQATEHGGYLYLLIPVTTNEWYKQVYHNFLLKSIENRIHGDSETRKSPHIEKYGENHRYLISDQRLDGYIYDKSLFDGNLMNHPDLIYLSEEELTASNLYDNVSYMQRYDVVNGSFSKKWGSYYFYKMFDF